MKEASRELRLTDKVEIYIYEQVYGIIMEYIKLEENNILNVPSATIDFTTSVLFECCSLWTKHADIGHWLHIQNQINLRRDCVTKSQLMMSMLGRSKSDKTGN